MANEVRLIDANAIANGIADYLATNAYLNDTAQSALEMVALWVCDAPTVDAVEVPCRCKECKYWRHYDHLGCTEFVKVCTLAYYMIGENGYCLYGERSEGE